MAGNHCYYYISLRSSYRRCSIQKVGLKKFIKIHMKTPVSVSFLIKLQSSACNFIKKRDSGTGFFSCKFCENFKNIFFFRTPPVAVVFHIIIFILRPPIYYKFRDPLVILLNKDCICFLVKKYIRWTLQMQPWEVCCQKRFSWKFRKIHRITPVPESLF